LLFYQIAIRQSLTELYQPSMIFASWLGTYLDLILVKKQLYSFPVTACSMAGVVVSSEVLAA